MSQTAKHTFKHLQVVAVALAAGFALTACGGGKKREAAKPVEKVVKVATITVAEGDNHIIVVSGANFGITPTDIEAEEARIAAADIVLCQLEIPMDCVLAAARLAKKHARPFVLNPAPAQALPAELRSLVSVLTPNAYELALSLGLPADTPVETLIRQSGCQVVMTLGSDGALYNDDTGILHRQSTFKVNPVDTTGAGDTFNAALAVFWQQGIAPAVKQACAAAALSVTKAGAQGGMPTAAELAEFLKQQA